MSRHPATAEQRTAFTPPRNLLILGTTNTAGQAGLECLPPPVKTAPRHRPPPDWPFTDPPQGMPVLGPGLAAVIEPALISGRYALFTWLIDLDDGRMRAPRGLYTMVIVS